MSPAVPLADGFPTISRTDWHALVAAALAKSRGDTDPDDVERLLATPTDDGYAVQPLYTAADVAACGPLADPGNGDFVRGATPADGAGWEVRQRHWVGEHWDSAAAITDDLANGVDSIWLTVEDRDGLEGALAALDLAAVPVALEGFRRGAEVAQAFLALLGDGPVAPTTSLGLDPIGQLAVSGSAGDVEGAMELAEQALGLGIRAFTIDGTIYHDGGASFADEVAAGTAAGVETLRSLTNWGLEPADAARLIDFRWAVTDDQFASMAKLRAARLVWHRVLEVSGVEGAAGQHQHAVTSAAMLTVRDPTVNLIRNCVACFAGGTGGAEAVTVLPHTLAVGDVDEFARRMARNTQHLLLRESHAGEVADPAGGSYYVESRTRLLARGAWSWLREIEGIGGMRNAVTAGVVANRVGRGWVHRQELTADRKAPITGVSEFPDRKRRAEPPMGWQRPDGSLQPHRYAEVYEHLRDRADAADPTPMVPLITLGSLARHAARQAFAENLFAAGGVGTQTVPFEPDLVLPDPSPVVCICGAEGDYAEGVAPAAAAAVASGATTVLVAGKPGRRAKTDKTAGVTGYIHSGCDVIAVLEQTLSELGVAQ